MPWTLTPKEETAAIAAVVAKFPEADAPSVAQMVLEENYDLGEEPEDLEVEQAFWHLQRRAREEWACPEPGGRR